MNLQQDNRAKRGLIGEFDLQIPAVGSSSRQKTALAVNPSAALAEQAKSMIVDPQRGRENFVPDFHFTTHQGQEISLEQLTGKVIVLD